MITTVATWLCTCGNRVKILAETNRDKPAATIVATCPNCGHQQLIDAEWLMSVTINESDATDLPSEDSTHVSLEVLWRFRAEYIPLSDEELNHVGMCRDCVADLVLCQA